MHTAISISLVVSVVYEHDAISDVAYMMLSGLQRRYAQAGLRADIRLYCLETDRSDTRVVTVADAPALLADPFFRQSDLIMCHYGFHSALMDAMALAPATATKILFFHGITPPQFLADDQSPVSVQSFAQLGVFAGCDAIITTTRYVAQCLRAYAFTHLPVHPCGLPLKFAPVPKGQPRTGGVVSFVGRFVPLKNVHLLIKAFAALLQTHPGTTLRLHGSGTYSDTLYLDRLRQSIAALQLQAHVAWHFDLDDAALGRSLGESTVLVLPSSHEGFGMPVFEALAAGCPCIISDLPALREVSGDLALSFALAAPDSLAAALSATLDAAAMGSVLTNLGILPYPVWLTRVEELLAISTPEAFFTRVHAVCRDVTRDIDPDVRKSYLDGYARMLDPLLPRRPICDIDRKYADELHLLGTKGMAERLTASLVEDDDHTFLATCYRVLFRREPDEVGLQTKIDSLAGGRRQVVLTMLESPEFARNGYPALFVKRLQRLVESLPEPAGGHSLRAVLQTLPKHQQQQILSRCLEHFDEAAYLRHNPDIQAAVAAGQFASGYDHWIAYGFLEGRVFT